MSQIRLLKAKTYERVDYGAEVVVPGIGDLVLVTSHQRHQ
jgi:hypothetical protein